MNKNKQWLTRFFFVVLFSLTVSLAIADDDIESVSAGSDQTVNAGETVNLTGVITYEDDDEYKHHNKHKHHDKYKHHKKHNKNHKRKHGGDEVDDEIDDELIVSWTQTSGTAVALESDNTLTLSFVAPDATISDEILTFTLSVSDDDGELLASDSVDVTVLALQNPTSIISGRLTTVDGSVIPNVAVNALSSGTSQAIVISGSDGRFSVELNAASDFVLQMSATGYADQVVPVRSPNADSSVFFDITMIAREAAQTFSAAVGGTLTGADGASVVVSADSFVDAAGNPVAGDIDLTITPVDVSRPASLAAFPGEFSGVLEGAVTDTPIISFGAIEFEFTQAGQAVQLAPGQTANVVIPMYFDAYQDGTPVAIGDMIPLWSLNEETGIWQQEGSGTVISSADSPTGFAMDAIVSHFSWWNCDVSANRAQAIVTVFGPDAGTALIKAHTSANIGWRPDTVDTVSAVSVPTPPLYIPSNGEVCFWAEISFDNGSTGTTPEVCITAAPNSLNNIDLIAPVGGPVNIITRPAATADVLDVVGYLGFPVDRVQIQPSTYETSVSYSIISGTLPGGLSLNPVAATSAEIAGIVGEVGAFSVVVQGTDVDGNTDTVTINYSVTADVPPPVLEPIVWVDYFGAPSSIDMNDFNTGGPVANWSLDFDPSLEEVALPPYVSIDPVTGILTITDACRFWQGLLTATNASGSVTVSIRIADNWCA